MKFGVIRFCGAFGITLALTLVLLSEVSHGTSLQIDETLYGKPSTVRSEYDQMAFLRGEWAIDMVVIDLEGTRSSIAHQAYLTAFYHNDGKTVQTCFVAPNFYSTDLRGLNEESGVWQGHFLNSNAQRSSHFTIEFNENTFVTNVPGGYSGHEPFDLRSVARNVSSSGFISDVFRTTDNGVTWRHIYEMTYSRILSNSAKRKNC